MKRLAVLASGSGTNLQALLDAKAAGTLEAEIAVVVSNRGDAGALCRAMDAGVPTVVLPLVERLEQWAAICRKYAVDVVIDHQVLYSDHWPEYALMSRAEGASTIISPTSPSGTSSPASLTSRTL